MFGIFITTMHLLIHHIYVEIFFSETSNHSSDSAPLQPKFGVLWLLDFPKIKVTFEREEISDPWCDSGKYNGLTGRTVWGPKVPTLEGTEASSSHVQCSLYLVSSSVNVSIFHITCLDTFWIDLVFSLNLWIEWKGQMFENTNYLQNNDFLDFSTQETDV